jgi:hypothetical protein
VSPLLAYDATSTLAAAKELFARAQRPNLKILATGQTERRRLPSGKKLTPAKMVAEVTALVRGPIVPMELGQLAIGVGISGLES